MNLSAPSVTGNIIQGNKVVEITGKGGGIHCSEASPIISKNTIMWNESSNHGGGIYCHEGFPDILGNTIFENSAVETGGGIYCWRSTVEITDNEIEANSAEYGGGIWCADATVSIFSNSITLNNATQEGGGICCSIAIPSILGNSITLNTAALKGGGIFYKETDSDIKENWISGNKADRGAGIYLTECSPKLISNVLSGNTASLEGGGICCYNASPMFTGNIIAANRSDNMGGGIYNYDSFSTIVNNAIEGNSADYCGGGIHCSLSTLTATNNTMTGNSADTYGGGAICCFVDSLVDVTNTVLWNNSAPTGKEICLLNITGPSTLNISYSDLEGGISGVHVDGGCVLRWGQAMIDADPLFVDPAGNDFHLAFNSPCRDTGDNSAVTELYDFEGDPRIAWGETVDIGADEFYTHLYCTGDFTPSGSIEGKLIGLPGTSPVGLFFGSGVLEPPLPTAWGNFYLQAPWFLIPLVPIPADGVLVLPATLPTTPPAPYDLPMQALIGLEPDSLSNLYVLEVR
jgi:hypothetical protein